jgi:hypothetical protein
MSLENVSVEDLSRKLEKDRMVIIQEVTNKKQRQWIFQGERLKTLREQGIEQADFSNVDEVILVCDEMEKCQELANNIQPGVQVGYLAGGYLAWGQFYHPVMVGFDEQIKVWQIHRLAKGCLSYMVISGEQCLVIDPCYHIDYYLGLAHSQRTDIKCLVDTQIHKDHVSGGPRLAAKTTSPYYVPSHNELQADSKALEKETQLTVGQATLKVIPLSNSAQQHAVGLLLNEQYLFMGDMPLEALRRSVERQVDFNGMNQTVLVLPAHLQTLGVVNEHGIVATTWETIEKENLGQDKARTISVSQPRAREQDIIRLNLSQEEINLDTANQLELGLEHTP